MSILIDEKTRVIVQGITGSEGSFWTRWMIQMGTNVVAGVTPGKGGQTFDQKVPIFNTVKEAMVATNADASMLFVPPKFVKAAAIEAIEAGVSMLVAIADGIPLHEQVEIRSLARKHQCLVIGGNTSGIISPGKAMMGALPYWIDRVYKPGHIGVMTRSGSLTNEVTSMIVKEGFGVSTLVGVGGDPVPGTRFAELLAFYQQDRETQGVVIIGELGGSMEEEVAEAMSNGVFTKPLVAYIGGRTAPEGVRMGHAGAIVSGGKGSAEDKSVALERAGALVAKRPSQVGKLLKQRLGME